MPFHFTRCWSGLVLSTELKSLSLLEGYDCQILLLGTEIDSVDGLSDRCQCLSIKSMLVLL